MLRFGTIGSGWICDEYIHGAKDSGLWELTAVYSRTRERAEEYAKKHGAAHAFTSVEELALSDAVDAVYIASPTGCHFAQAREMLLAGKHVLCEKPAVVTAAQLRELLDIARERGVVFLEAMRLVHDDALDVIAAALPEIGALRRVTFEFTQYSSRYDRFRAGEQGINTFDVSLSNGGIMDMGCYCLHAMVRLFGAPERVRADCFKLSNGFDGGGIVLLRYPGFVAEAIYSKVSRQVAPTTLLGEDGAILLDDINHIRRIWLQPRQGEARDLPYREKLPNNMMYELSHFCAMVSGDMDPAPWNRWSQITLEVMDAARADMGVVFPADRAGG